jgi:hypothetical protein
VTTFKPDITKATVNTSTYHYSANGSIDSVSIVDGRPRTVSFVTDVNGMVLSRDENDNNPNIGDPKQLHYYFNGIAVGDVSNDGTSNVDYAQSIAEHTQVPGAGPFQNGASSGSFSGDFDQSYDAINGLNFDSTASHLHGERGRHAGEHRADGVGRQLVLVLDRGRQRHGGLHNGFLRMIRRMNSRSSPADSRASATLAGLPAPPGAMDGLVPEWKTCR